MLAAAGGKSATPDHPLLKAADELYQAAADGVRGARATERSKVHHGHLLRATERLGAALVQAHVGVRVDPILKPLQSAYAELQSASKLLPGFTMISFEQGCCTSGAGK